MVVPRDPLAEQPVPPGTPGDRLPEGELAPSERDEDPARAEQSLTATPARPLTDEEKAAATADPGRPTRTYAPHSQRVPKDPQPGHEELAAGGSGGEGVDTPPDVPIAGADRSLPEEIR
jgi:hypothetical protein